MRDGWIECLSVRDGYRRVVGSFAWAGVYHDHATDELKTLNELSFKKSL